MKIHSAFGTNINHVQQQRVSTSPTLSPAKEAASLASHQTPKSILTHQLLNTHSNEGFLQALHQGVGTLEKEMEGLRALVNTPSSKETFDALREKMMDLVDNSLYENHSLFHSTSSLLLPEGSTESPSFGFLETLEYDDEAGLEEALKYLNAASLKLEKALFVNRVTTFNTLAALSTGGLADEKGDAYAHIREHIGTLLKDV